MQAEARALLEEQGIIDEFGRAERKIGFTQSRVKALRGFILRYLHQNGYLSARVTPACELHSGRILKGKVLLRGRTVRHQSETRLLRVALRTSNIGQWYPVAWQSQHRRQRHYR